MWPIMMADDPLSGDSMFKLSVGAKSDLNLGTREYDSLQPVEVLSISWGVLQVVIIVIVAVVVESTNVCCSGSRVCQRLTSS